MAARWWLLKTEPDEFSIDDLESTKVAGWEGVRNYQARNFMRDDMKKSDQVFIYHSSIPSPAIVGVAIVDRQAYPDPTQFDPQSDYFDEKATPQEPRWYQVDVRFQQKLGPITLSEIKAHPELEDMMLVTRSRLSVMPVEDKHARILLAMADET